MDTKTGLFFAAALYVGTACAGTPPPQWAGMCETWTAPGQDPTYRGGCTVNFSEANGEAQVLIDMYDQPLVELNLAAGTCTLNGAPCLQIPAGRRDGVRYQYQGVRALEFTRPME
jgi:hypothetical protein